MTLTNKESKSTYSRLNEYNTNNNNNLTINDSNNESRSSSPSQSFPMDQHFAYSTSLRRSEPDISNIVSPLASRFAYEPTNSHSTNHHHHHHPFAHTTSPLTPSSHFSTQSIQQTLDSLNTSSTLGLLSSKVPAIREISGPNEFEVPAKPPLWKRFASQFYESPLILLLLGSAGVSAVVGNYDDAASIIAAIVIVVTGKGFLTFDVLFSLPLTNS